MAVATPCCPAPGFGDDARLAHAPGQQDLADAVVDLVRPRVEQVFALEVNLRPAQFPGQALRQVKRRGPAAELSQVILELALELRVLLRPEVLGLQLVQRVHQRLRHVTAPVRAEVAARIGHRLAGNRTHTRQHSPPVPPSRAQPCAGNAAKTSFGFRPSDFFRISDFGLRIYPFPRPSEQNALLYPTGALARSFAIIPGRCCSTYSTSASVL